MTVRVCHDTDNGLNDIFQDLAFKPYTCSIFMLFMTIIKTGFQSFVFFILDSQAQKLSVDSYVTYLKENAII